MADDLKTLREAGLAIDGLRRELVAQINGLTNWTQGLAALGVVVGGFYGYQLYSLNYNVGSLANAVKTTQEQMTAIQAEMTGLRTDTATNLTAIRLELAAIRQALNVQPVPPEKGGFPEKQGNLAPTESNQPKSERQPSQLPRTDKESIKQMPAEGKSNAIEPMKQ